MSVGLNMSGRSVIVTGGTRGIGRGIAEAFLEAGADVIVCGRNAPERAPCGEGREALFTVADVRDLSQIDGVVALAQARFGRLDVLVNNAGGSPSAEAATASVGFFRAIIELNLVAPMMFAQRANTVMQQQAGGGVIINIASVSGTRPSPGTAAYGAAKAGLINLTRSLAVEWAPNVRVNAVTAGLVRTEQSHLHYGDESGIEAVAATVPLGRLGTTADIAQACLYLASPMASYVTGADIAVHGGDQWPAYLTAALAHQTGSTADGEDPQ